MNLDSRWVALSAKNHRMKYKFYTLLLLLGLNASAAFSQTVIRGPYLQSNTHEGIIVMWRTSNATSSKVWYGTDSTNLTQTVFINDNVANHIVPITGLQPYTKYYYIVGDATNQLASDVSVQHFKTHPIPGTPTPTRVWATGDFGRGNAGQIETKQAFTNYTGERGADVWIWLGDNAYQDGTDNEYQTKVFALQGFSDIFTYTPFWPSPGNHDYNTVWAQSTLLGIPYQNIPLENHQGPYFDMIEVPRFAEAGGFPSQLEVFYSFDYGDVHFLSLNSEVFDYTFSYDGINRMKQWIEQDLQQNTRKFTIAYFHQPPYSKGSHDSDDVYELAMKAMREKVIPLLEQYDIDLVVCGHSHVFERSYLLKGHFGNSSSFDAATMKMQNGVNGNFDEGTPYIKDNSQSTSEGTVYVVCGNSGSSEGGPSLDHPAMFYNHGASDAMGSFIIDVNRNRLDGKYLKKTGEIADQFTILKKDVVLTSLPNLTICQGDSINVAALFTGGSLDMDYQWSNSSATDSVVSFAPSVTTQYTLTVTDNLTGQVETTNFTINVLPFPTPVITEPLIGTLSAPSGTGYSYQWYINGNIISGATSQYYEPMFDGNYSVLVTNTATGCSAMSTVYVYPSGLGVENQTNQTFVLYPNPADNQITVTLPEGLTDNHYQITDLAGKVVSAGVLKGGSMTISVKELTTGVYHLELNGEAGKLKRAFTKK